MSVCVRYGCFDGGVRGGDVVSEGGKRRWGGQAIAKMRAGGQCGSCRFFFKSGTGGGGGRQGQPHRGGGGQRGEGRNEGGGVYVGGVYVVCEEEEKGGGGGVSDRPAGGAVFKRERAERLA